MKILHTADWHLGRTLAGRDLLDDQRQTLDHLIEIARANSVDAIVIAGDVYDRAQPAEDAVILFGDVLEKLRKIAPVICIAGNHDSAGRISYLSGLLTERGVYMAGVEFGAPKPIDIECANGNIRFHLMPYATPEEVRSALEVDGIRTHDEATRMRLALADIAADIQMFSSLISLRKAVIQATQSETSQLAALQRLTQACSANLHTRPWGIFMSHTMCHRPAELTQSHGTAVQFVAIRSPRKSTRKV